ncbi:MAG TPA: T9SS type A sorting domain-containing protein, partial [bacterium]|nr:T9SS type A sorting domain-containing protein [bacterium]
VPGATYLINTATLTYSGLATPKTVTANVEVSANYLVHLAVYNSVGELIKQILIQTYSQPMDSIQLEQTQEITSLNGTVYVIVNGQAIASWNGTNQAGDPVSNGQYYIKLDSQDPYGVVTSVSQPVVVNRILTKVEVDIFNSVGEIVRHLYNYVNDPDGTEMSDIKLSSAVLNPNNTSGMGAPGQVQVEVETNGSGSGVSLTWDGRSDGGQVVANGQYMIEARWTDSNGGSLVDTKDIVVLGSGNSPAQGKVYASPQILSSGDPVTKLQINSPLALTFHVNVYDVAGELLKNQKVVQGTQSATWDSSGVASGVYILVVTLTDPSGQFVDRQTVKVVVLH